MADLMTPRVGELIAEAAGTDGKPDEAFVPISAGDLIDRYPDLRPQCVHGLLRNGETMNLIAASKVKKSYLLLDLALSIATGQAWIGFPVEQGKVLILDNELHRETLAYRLRIVAEARGFRHEEYRDLVQVIPLRGMLRDLGQIANYLDTLKSGEYRLVGIDAFYRTLPPGVSENDNAHVAALYNRADQCASRAGTSIAFVHHSSKGSQGGKGVTDVGSGAGAMARAVDTHVVLRPHEEEDVAVLEAAMRSQPPLRPLCIRWKHPTWNPADDLDPSLLLDAPRRRAAPGTEGGTPAAPWTEADFVRAFVPDEPTPSATILNRAKADRRPGRVKLSDRAATDLLRSAEHLRLVDTTGGTGRSPKLYTRLAGKEEGED